MPGRDRLHAPRFRDDPPHVRRRRRRVTLLRLERPRPHLERPLQAAPLRPTRHRRTHRLPGQRKTRLHGLRHGVKAERPGRKARLPKDGRRRQILAVPLGHRAGAGRLRHHALNGPSVACRNPHDDPLPREGSANGGRRLDRRLRIPRRWPRVGTTWIARLRTWAKGILPPCCGCATVVSASFTACEKPLPDRGPHEPRPRKLVGHALRAQNGWCQPRSGVSPDGRAADGKVVAVYYFHDKSRVERTIQATIWDPGR